MFGEVSNRSFFLEPGKGLFMQWVPLEGFEIVKSGDIINIPSRTSRKMIPVEVISRDNKETREEALLLPKSRGLILSAPFFKVGKPLFQLFANLSSESQIINFANAYGQLLPFSNDSGHILFPNAFIQDQTEVWELESISLWKREIKEMKQMINAVGCYEQGGEAERFVRTCNDEQQEDFLTNEFLFYELDVGSPFLFKAEKDDLPHDVLLQGIMEFFDYKLFTYPSTPFYMDKEGHPQSHLLPHSLAGMLWLQFAQSFFKDGPEYMTARRCFYCGQYDTEDMRQRKNGPFAGLWYHERCYRTERARIRREKKAQEQGKKIRKYRGRKRFLTEEPERNR